MRVRFAGSSAGLRPRSIAFVLSALILVPAFSNGGELARVVSMWTAPQFTRIHK
jgi:hypothetical protein